MLELMHGAKRRNEPSWKLLRLAACYRETAACLDTVKAELPSIADQLIFITVNTHLLSWVSSPKNENSVSNDSPSCCSKPLKGWYNALFTRCKINL